jgi:hypothetical protein
MSVMDQVQGLLHGHRSAHFGGSKLVDTHLAPPLAAD